MNAVVDTARRQAEEYAGDEDRPLGSYLGTLAVYGVTAGTLALLGGGCATGPRRSASPIWR